MFKAYIHAASTKRLPKQIAYLSCREKKWITALNLKFLYTAVKYKEILGRKVIYIVRSPLPSSPHVHYSKTEAILVNVQNDHNVKLPPS